MKELLSIATSTEFIILVMAVVAGLLIYSLIKQLFRVAMFVGAILVLYLGYTVLTGQGVPENNNAIIDRVKKGSSSITEIIEKTVKDKGTEIFRDITGLEKVETKKELPR
jgi:ABC-type bacteriocin/lantibiotic exporter with double-glycine peptidase domain